MWISPSRPGRLAWLALLGLASVAVTLGGSAWLSIQAAREAPTAGPFVDACVVILGSASGGFGALAAIHPVSAAALALLGASMVWAWLRLGGSLARDWCDRRRLARCDPGRFPALEHALAASPDIGPDRIRIVRSVSPDAFTVGIVRPIICLSERLLDGATGAEIEAVLRHEHAHVEARDPLRLAVVRFLSDFLWFLPVARALARAFSITAELRADESAVSAGGDPLALASAIVKSAGRLPSRIRLAAGVGGLPMLEHRILRLLGRTGTLSVRVVSASSLSSGLILLAFLASLVAPALAGAGSHGVDGVASMTTMMDPLTLGCGGPGEAHSPAGSMTRGHCGDRGHQRSRGDRSSDHPNDG